jgi:hypothetical protein
MYAAVALALALWELQPLALVAPAAYGFFALLAAWRRYEPDDVWLPLVFTAIAFGLYAAYATVRTRDLPQGSTGLATEWAQVLLGLAFAYALAAPIVGWVRLDILADESGLVGFQSFEETGLYQTSALAVALLGVIAATQAWLVRRVELAIASSAVLMVAVLLQIGHYRPENVQAYTAPLGAYLLAGALLALRARGVPADARALIGPVEAVGAGLIMGPSFAQSLDEGAWEFGLLLLVEGLAFVALALVQRRLWLLGISVGFVVLDGVHYLFFAGGPVPPTWAILAIAGMAVMAAGTAILLGRDRWMQWQRAVVSWWQREPVVA